MDNSLAQIQESNLYYLKKLEKGMQVQEEANSQVTLEVVKLMWHHFKWFDNNIENKLNSFRNVINES